MSTVIPTHLISPLSAASPTTLTPQQSLKSASATSLSSAPQPMAPVTGRKSSSATSFPTITLPSKRLSPPSTTLGVVPEAEPTAEGLPPTLEGETTNGEEASGSSKSTVSGTAPDIVVSRPGLIDDDIPAELAATFSSLSVSTEALLSSISPYTSPNPSPRSSHEPIPTHVQKGETTVLPTGPSTSTKVAVPAEPPQSAHKWVAAKRVAPTKKPVVAADGYDLNTAVGLNTLIAKLTPSSTTPGMCQLHSG